MLSPLLNVLSFVALAISFVLGGLLFLPLVIATVLGVLLLTSPVAAPHYLRKTGLAPPAPVEPTEDDVALYRAGWITVRRTYEPLTGPNDGTYVGALVSGYRSFMDNRSREPRKTRPKEHFFGVLKQNVLFLYDADDQVDCWAAVQISSHRVSLYPENGLDGELFVKRNAICLCPFPGPGTSYDQSIADAHDASESATHDLETSSSAPWFLFVKVNTDKEDWYHSLIQASKLSVTGDPNSATAGSSTTAQDKSLFDPDDMARLVEGIDAQPDSIPTRWLNALLGRVFLSVYRTESLEAYLVERIVRKLKRVKTPAMLSEIKVREVHVGRTAPFFSKPMLKDLTSDGDASMEVQLSYVGEMRITIETVATINLGSRFKPYSVRLVLAVVLKELEGSLLVKMKKPPSNRLWYGFSSMPRMVMSVEPVVSTRQIKWSLITSPIESRIREVILESMVVPHMDDLAFFNSKPYFHRGGIWADALRKEQDVDVDHSGDVGVGQEDLVEEDLDKPAPSSLAAEVGAATSALEGSGSEARHRTRRRRSSEGDRNSLAFTPGSTPPLPSASSGSTTASSLSSFSLANWKANRDAFSAASSAPSAPGKRTSWFSTSSSSLNLGTSTSPSRQSSSASTSTQETTHASPAPTEGATSSDADLSAAKLRDILTKRAKEREKEKEAAVAKDSAAADSAPVLSALSLTAPAGLVPTSRSRSETPDPLPASTPSKLPSSPASISTPLVRDPSTSSNESIKLGLPSAPALPPRRSHQSTQSADVSSLSTSPSTTSLLSTWRTKAADKQALAAGVAQAKDTMKRWGATWNARKASGAATADDLAGSPPQDGGSVLSSSSSSGVRDESPSGGAGTERDYRDYRAGKLGSHHGTYYGGAATPPDLTPSRETSTPALNRRRTQSSILSSASASGSTSSAAAALPFVTPPQQATTKLNTVPTFAPGSPPRTEGMPDRRSAAGAEEGKAQSSKMYKPAIAMTVPGIRDGKRRMEVAGDHLGVGEVGKGASESTPSSSTPLLASVPTVKPSSERAGATPKLASEPRAVPSVVEEVEELKNAENAPKEGDHAREETSTTKEVVGQDGKGEGSTGTDEDQPSAGSSSDGTVEELLPTATDSKVSPAVVPPRPESPGPLSSPALPPRPVTPSQHVEVEPVSPSRPVPPPPPPRPADHPHASEALATEQPTATQDESKAMSTASSTSNVDPSSPNPPSVERSRTPEIMVEPATPVAKKGLSEEALADEAGWGLDEDEV